MRSRSPHRPRRAMRPAWLLALVALLWQAALPALATAAPGAARVLQVDVCSAAGRWQMDVDIGPSPDDASKARHAERHALHCGACGAMASAPPAAMAAVPSGIGGDTPVTDSVRNHPRGPSLLPEARAPPCSTFVA